MINNVKKGVLTIVLATLFFAIMDGVSRYLAENYNVFVINMVRSWVLALLVIVISLRKKKRNFEGYINKTALHPIY